MALKDFIRKMVPKQLLDWNRARKKDAQRLILAAQRDAGNVLTKEILVEQFKKIEA